MGPSFVKDIGESFKLTALSLCATQHNLIEKLYIIILMTQSPLNYCFCFQ